MSVRAGSPPVQPVEQVEVEGVDYGWVMQTTFVVTILVGAPAVAVLSTFVTLDTWGARAAFAVRVGAPIWFLTAVAVYARRTEAGDGYSNPDDAADDDPPRSDDATGDDPSRSDDATGDDSSRSDDGN